MFWFLRNFTAFKFLKSAKGDGKVGKAVKIAAAKDVSTVGPSKILRTAAVGAAGLGLLAAAGTAAAVASGDEAAA